MDGAVCLVTTVLTTLALQIHQAAQPRRALSKGALGVCFLAGGARTALADGVVARKGWWHSPRTGAGLTAVSIAAALSALLLRLNTVAGGF